jgi:outer membrane protein assembly factor BamE (lipoprotein component of BamABCDE complex)
MIERFGKGGAQMGGIALALVLALGASACSRVRTHQGFIIDTQLVDAIQPGVDNRDSVEKTLGRPTFAAQFSQGDWYYVQRESKQLAFADRRPRSLRCCRQCCGGR